MAWRQDRMGRSTSDQTMRNCDLALEQGDYGAKRAHPKEKHPPHDTHFDRAELRLEFGRQLGPQLGDALLQLRVEAREVYLKQVAELTAVGCVHLIEPLHELVRELVAESFVEFSRQLGSHRHPKHPLDVRRLTYHTLGVVENQSSSRRTISVPIGCSGRDSSRLCLIPAAPQRSRALMPRTARPPPRPYPPRALFAAPRGHPARILPGLAFTPAAPKRRPALRPRTPRPPRRRSLPR